MPPRKKSRRHAKSRTWQDIAQEARQHRQESLLKASQVCKQPVISADGAGADTKSAVGIPGKRLDPEFSRLTSINVSKLVDDVAAGSVSSTAVVKAFLGRALIAHEFVSVIMHRT